MIECPPAKTRQRKSKRSGRSEQNRRTKAGSTDDPQRGFAGDTHCGCRAQPSRVGTSAGARLRGGADGCKMLAQQTRENMRAASGLIRRAPDMASTRGGVPPTRGGSLRRFYSRKVHYKPLLTPLHSLCYSTTKVYTRTTKAADRRRCWKLLGAILKQRTAPLPPAPSHHVPLPPAAGLVVLADRRPPLARPRRRRHSPPSARRRTPSRHKGRASSRRSHIIIHCLVVRAKRHFLCCSR